jgi:sugar diacid utilization regulator
VGRSGFVQVYLIEASAATRDSLVDAYREALSEQALVIKCPAYNDHVIVLAEAPAGTGNVEVATRLRQLRDPNRDSRRLLLGESRPTLIDRTSRAYGEALRALVAARSLPRYAATYRPSSLDLTQLLGADARRWAAQFLRPMFQLPPGSRTMTAAIVTDALLFGTAEAARMTGVHRNTVTSHLKEVGRRMELDLGRYPARAALVLALNLDRRGAQCPARAAHQHDPQAPGALRTAVVRPEAADPAQGRRLRGHARTAHPRRPEDRGLRRRGGAVTR